MSYVSFEWTGEVGASTSIKKVDGVEVSRNLGYPLVINSLQFIFAESQSYPSPGEAEVLTTGETTSSTLPRTQRVSASDNLAPVLPGQGYAMTVQVRHSRGLPARVRAWFLDASGSFMEHADGSYVESTAYGRSVISGITPDEAGYLGFQIAVDSQTSLGGSVEGDLFWAKDLHVATATTEVEALAQVEPYFDGDTPNYFTGTTYEWVGEPHASQSVKRIDGVEVARNHVPGFGAWSGGSGVEVISGSHARLTGGTIDLTEALAVPVRPGASAIRWHAQGRSTFIRNGTDPEESLAGIHSGLRDDSGATAGVANSFPADGQWHDIDFKLDLSDDATTAWIRLFSDSNFSSPEHEVRNLQFAFDGEEPEPYFDGDTPDQFTPPIFKVRQNGSWHPVVPRVCVAGAYHQVPMKQHTNGTYE